MKIAKYETPAVTADTPVDKNNLTATQWLSVISIVVSLAGIFYKREDIKGFFTKKTAYHSTARSSKLSCYANKRHQTDGLKIN